MNFSTTAEDIDRSIKICGTPIPLPQGKVIRKGATTSQEHVRVPLPPQIVENYVNVKLYIDLFYVYKTPLLHTKSGQINLLLVQSFNSKVKHTIISGLNGVKKIYRSRGFRIVFFHGDNEFNINLLKHKMIPSDMNICAKDEHIHIIERSIRTFKELSRCTTNSVPYTIFPIIITKSLFQCQLSWLNSFLPTNGISYTIIPATIVLGKPKPDLCKPKICFGAHALAFTKKNNDMTTIGVPSITL